MLMAANQSPLGLRVSVFFRLAIFICVALVLYVSCDFWLSPRQDDTERPTLPFTPALPAQPAALIHQADYQEGPHTSTAGTSSPSPLKGQVEYENTPQAQPLPGFKTQESSHAWNSSSDACIEMPGARNVMLLLKTGATELYQKLPIHFLTTLKCIPSRNFMIFSDLNQTFADHFVLDALADVGSELRDHHPDFGFYRKLQRYQAYRKDVSELKGGMGWDLDRWKFFPILHTAFEAANADTQWFVMIEADTSLSWTNLLQWLKTMDPQQPFYLGAQNVIGSTTFAHGGSGIVISRRALEMLEETRRNEGTTEYDRRWEKDTSEHCCGDEIIARAFLEANIPLTPAWPLLQGETITSLDWTSKHWCTPAISWHHVGAAEIDDLWRFEQAWIDVHGWDDPFRFRDVFVHFIDQHIKTNRTRWNNLSKDHEYVNSSLAFSSENKWNSLRDFEWAATESQDACAAACLHPSHAECVQWMFMAGRCYLGNTVRFGEADVEDWTSGWVAERLEQYKDAHRGCRVHWSGDDDEEDR